MTTATRRILASLVVVTLVAVGVFFYVQNRSGCPADYASGSAYDTNAEVRFAGQVWRSDAPGTTEIPGPNATQWTAVGTC